ncbi:MAG: leucine-rich repeat domain-containing protein, partial [Candidatus Odinarchaeota archaeon]
MSLKILKDTLSLSEFTGQRFLYGNFLPALYGVVVLTSLMTGMNFLTFEELTGLIPLTLMAFFAAFVTHRASRKVVYRFCSIEAVFRNFLAETWEKRGERLILSVGEEKKANVDLARAIAELREEDFYEYKKHFENSFYKIPSTVRAEELRRKETIYLLAFWGTLWASLCVLFSIIFYHQMQVELFTIAGNLIVDVYMISLGINLLLMIVGYLVMKWQKKTIKELQLEVLPFYFKRETSAEIEATIKAVEELEVELLEKDSEVKKVVVSEMEREIRLKYRAKMEDSADFARLNMILEKRLPFIEAGAIEKALKAEKLVGSDMSPSDAIAMLAIAETVGQKPIYTIDEKNNVASLDLGERDLHEIPNKIGQLSSLQELNLYSNQLIELPSEIGQLTNLRKLLLMENQLIELPSEIGQLTNLQKLDLMRNELTSLPAEMGQLKNLEILDLESNHLKELPPQIGQLMKLQKADLMRNELTSLPAEIGQLTNLEILDLESNHLKELPPQIGQLTNL